MIMRWSRVKSRSEDLRFGTRAEAFGYMLKEQMERGVDAMDAAEKADRFATLCAENLGLPEKKEPEKEGMDRYLEAVDKVMNYCDRHPKAVDMLTGVATFVLGAVAGRAQEAANEPQPPVVVEPIDFEKLE